MRGIGDVASCLWITLIVADSSMAISPLAECRASLCIFARRRLRNERQNAGRIAHGPLVAHPLPGLAILLAAPSGVIPPIQHGTDEEEDEEDVERDVRRVETGQRPAE